MALAYDTLTTVKMPQFETDDDGKKYQIEDREYNYRLATYADWLKECERDPIQRSRFFRFVLKRGTTVLLRRVNPEGKMCEGYPRTIKAAWFKNPEAPFVFLYDNQIVADHSGKKVVEFKSSTNKDGDTYTWEVHKSLLMVQLHEEAQIMGVQVEYTVPPRKFNRVSPQIDDAA